MLTLPITVPEAALVDREARRLAGLTREAGGVWLRAADGRPDGWPAATDPSAVALPVGETPVFAMHRGRMALHLTPRQNGGFRLSHAVPDHGRWSAAILWASDTPAQALLAVRPESGKPVHLSETENRELTFRDDGGSSVTLRHGGEAWRLTVMACADGKLKLAQDGRVAEISGLSLSDTSASLLIGCRKPGQGMRRALGEGRIAEVLFWPGMDILSEPAAPLRGALDDFLLWES